MLYYVQQKSTAAPFNHSIMGEYVEQDSHQQFGLLPLCCFSKIPIPCVAEHDVNQWEPHLSNFHVFLI